MPTCIKIDRRHIASGVPGAASQAPKQPPEFPGGREVARCPGRLYRPGHARMFNRETAVTCAMMARGPAFVIFETRAGEAIQSISVPATRMRVRSVTHSSAAVG
jgi:hypothetical protein